MLPGAGPAPLTAIASLNYTVSQINYPAPPVMANPPVPYDAIKDNHTDLAREAVPHAARPGLAPLASPAGPTSCPATAAAPAWRSSPSSSPRGTTVSATFPSRPALPRCSASTAYDLPALAAADGLGASHAHPRDDYEKFLSRAFGTDKDAWPDASPASFDPAMPSVSWLDFTCL